MAKQHYEIVNTTINLFKNGRIICKSPTLAKQVISYANRVITIFKRKNNIEEIYALNNIYLKKEKVEVNKSIQIDLLNMIRLCLSKLNFGRTNYIYDIIRNKIIQYAYDNRMINGGCIQQNKLASRNLSRKYAYTTTHIELNIMNIKKTTGSTNEQDVDNDGNTKQ